MTTIKVKTVFVKDGPKINTYTIYLFYTILLIRGSSITVNLKDVRQTNTVSEWLTAGQTSS